MAYRVRKRKGARGAKGYDYKYGGVGSGWQIDWDYYHTDPRYMQGWDALGGKTQAQLGEGTSRLLSSGPDHDVGNPGYVYQPDVGARDSKFNERLEIDAIQNMWKHGFSQPKPAPAPAPAAAPVATTPPSLAPTKLDVSGGPAPVPGPSGSSAAGGGVFGSGTGAYQAQGVKSAALNPRRERMKLSSFNRGRRPQTLGTLNLA